MNTQLPLKIKKTISEHKGPFYDGELLFLTRKKKNKRLYRKSRNVGLKADFDLNTKLF